ncbi:hypothetical protein COCCADRAFT_22444 [Bipolaris zeicola 26-R-13]|uniref:Uncharacterized protein n=1 Tax=Cochliobolus carbonum (strain 26-R-13) TaxID=930089 RepID=W6YF24_COCC2|nr:uncharacterized protein COCCADRAFT_22444 [Bipolaris zeicola 26-R-13]EUC38097.1 hypothetical protein COCCADRAFT_22444 [Bipolaris zeicola 26-R-13]
MFDHLFDPDAFHRHPIPPAFSRTNYIVSGASRVQLPSFIPRDHRHAHPMTPHQHQHHHHPRPARRYSVYADPSPTSSDFDQTEDTYLQSESDSSLTHVKHSPPRNANANNNANNSSSSSNVLSPLHRTSFKLPHTTFANLPSTHTSSSILILPPTLTPLHIRIDTPSSTHQLRATVAGDMRFRDVVSQLVQQGQYADVRASVRLRGEWQEPGSSVRISEVVRQYAVNERGEVEVRIEVGRGGGGEGGREGRRGGGGYVGGIRGFRAWERETGRAWEIRD